MVKKLRGLLPLPLGTPRSAGNLRPRRRFVPGLECLEDRAVPATFTVTTTLDAVAADGKLSLREAITQANAHAGADTIILPAGVYRLALTGADNSNAAGDLDVTGSTLFLGAGAGATVIDGQQIDRVFDVLGTAPGSINVTFQGLTVRNGLASIGGGGIRVGNANLVVQDCAVTGNRTSGGGGGISNAPLIGTGNVTLVRSLVDRNVAAVGGGVLVQANDQHQGSVLTVIDSTIRRNIAGVAGGIIAERVNLTGSSVSGNTSSASGGGIDANTVNLTKSTVSGNSARAFGGGIFANTVNLTNSSVSGNHAGLDGGGIDADTATLTNSTVSGNSAAGSGGGIFARTVTLTTSTVSGNLAGRSGGGIFVTTTATLTNSTVSGNSAGIDSGGIEAFTATLISSTVSGNHANGDGGGIFASTVTLTTSTVSSNSAGGDGGGIFASTVTLTTSTVRGNSAGRDGGGIETGTATLTNSTVSGNSAATGDGGGIDANTATLTNSTVSGNSAGVHGGGILAHDLTLLNVTITDNSAHTGGGVFLSTGGTSSVRNSIIAENLNELDGDGPDVFGAFTSGGHNLIGDGSGATGFTNGTNGDQVGTAARPINPRLAPLANNGGPTRTHALLAGSPAIDKGDNAAAPATDQRGVGRPRDGDGNGSRIVDIGAFER